MENITLSDTNNIKNNKDVYATCTPLSNKLFISHSTKDEKYAEKLVDLLIDIGVTDKTIFCTSVPGHRVPPGEDFLDEIKKLLASKTVMVLFLLSENFYSSRISLCEMGAAWVLSRTNIPIFLPPFGPDDMKDIPPKSVQGLHISRKADLNDLQKAIVEQFGLLSPNMNRWERKRDEFLKTIQTEEILLQSETKTGAVASARTPNIRVEVGVGFDTRQQPHTDETVMQRLLGISMPRPKERDNPTLLIVRGINDGEIPVTINSWGLNLNVGQIIPPLTMRCTNPDLPVRLGEGEDMTGWVKYDDLKEHGFEFPRDKDKVWIQDATGKKWVPANENGV